jgi:signal peptidase II
MASEMRASGWRRDLAPWLLVAAVVVGLDQVTKISIERAFAFGDSLPITGFFNLVLTYNKGAAFSFLSAASGWQGTLFMLVGIAASGFIVYLLARRDKPKIFAAALALILGGAIGNVVDRLAYGHVIDFLDFHLGGWHWPAFNVADSAIVCGAGLLILEELLRMRKPG